MLENTKGQINSAEIVIAFSIFVVALAAFFLAWNLLLSSYAEEGADHEMRVTLLGISDNSIMSPGDPSDWESAGILGASSIGFAQSRSVLSTAKLAALQSSQESYEDVKEKMGAGPFQLYLSVQPVGAGVLYSFGVQPDLTDLRVSEASAERLALLDDGRVVKLKIGLWRIKERGRTI